MNFEQAFSSARLDVADDSESTLEQAMGALHEATFDDVEVSPGFDAAVMRRHKLAASRRKLTHWAPGALAAVLAALALLTFLQLVAVPSTSGAYAPAGVAAGR